MGAYLRSPAQRRAGIYVAGETKPGPITRADVEEGIAPPMPFCVDLFTRKAGKPERRSTILFPLINIPDTFLTRWRDAKTKRGMVLIFTSLRGRDTTAHISPLDDRLYPIGTQSFETTYDNTEPDYYSALVLNQTDGRGILKIGLFTSAGDEKETVWHEWNGIQFAPPKAAGAVKQAF